MFANHRAQLKRAAHRILGDVHVADTWCTTHTPASARSRGDSSLEIAARAAHSPETMAIDRHELARVARALAQLPDRVRRKRRRISVRLVQLQRDRRACLERSPGNPIIRLLALAITEC